MAELAGCQGRNSELANDRRVAPAKPNLLIFLTILTERRRSLSEICIQVSDRPTGLSANLEARVLRKATDDLSF